MRKCVEAALDSLSLENVIEMLEQSVQHEERRIEESCWRWGTGTLIIQTEFFILRIIDSSTLRIFDHENWPNMSRRTLAKLVKRETLRLDKNNTLIFSIYWVQFDWGSAVPRPAGVGGPLDQRRQV